MGFFKQTRLFITNLGDLKMKLTTERLKRLIREELEKITEEEENIYRSGKANKFQQGFRQFQDDEKKLIDHISSFGEGFMQQYAKQDAKWLNNMISQLESFGMKEAAAYLQKRMS
jgi:hypothetical protein